jgi:hypothetical protein
VEEFGKLAMSAEWSSRLGQFSVGKVRCRYERKQSDWIVIQWWSRTGGSWIDSRESPCRKSVIQRDNRNSIGPTGAKRTAAALTLL